MIDLERFEDKNILLYRGQHLLVRKNNQYLHYIRIKYLFEWNKVFKMEHLIHPWKRRHQ